MVEGENEASDPLKEKGLFTIRQLTIGVTLITNILAVFTLIHNSSFRIQNSKIWH